MTKDAEKSKVLSLFTSIFTGKTGLQEAQVSENRGEMSSKGELLLLGGEGSGWGTLKLDIYRSMGSDGMCPKVLWELADVIARLLLVIFGRSWESEEDPKDWKNVNVTLIFRKEGLGNP